MSTRVTLHRAALSTLLLLGLGSSAQSQSGTPIPQELRCDLEAGDRISLFTMDLEPETAVKAVQATVWFNTTKREVHIKAAYWEHHALVAGTFVSDETHCISYEPTAVAPIAGQGTDFFVAGYYERAGLVMIEKWSFTDLVLGQEQGTPDTKPKLTMTFSLRKTAVLLTDRVSPIRSLAFNMGNNSLLAMEDSYPNPVWEIPVDGSSPSILLDETTVPGLSKLRSMRAAFIEPTHPSGGGLLVVFAPWTDWSLSPRNVTSTATCYTWLDTDLDGEAETAGFTTWSAFVGDLYLEHERVAYSAVP